MLRIAISMLALSLIAGCQPKSSNTVSDGKKPARSTEVEIDPAVAKKAREEALRSTESPSADLIGAKAPSLSVDHWITDGQGAFPHVTDFQPDEMYVVTFWSKDSAKSVESMLFLSELQGIWGEHGVQFFGITDDSKESVETFLQEAHEGEGGIKHIDLANKYSVGADPDHSTYDSYMKKAGISKLPAAFVIGKTGQIEWIGHPNETVSILKQLYAGEWNRNRFAARLLQRQSSIAAELKEIEKANKLFDQWLALVPEEERFEIQCTRWNDFCKAGVPEASPFLAELLASSVKNPRNFQGLFRRVIALEKQKSIDAAAKAQFEAAIEEVVKTHGPESETSGNDIKIQYLLINNRVSEALELAKVQNEASKENESRFGKLTQALFIIQRLDLTDELKAGLPEFQVIAREDLERAMAKDPDNRRFERLKEFVDKMLEPRQTGPGVV